MADEEFNTIENMDFSNRNIRLNRYLKKLIN